MKTQSEPPFSLGQILLKSVLNLLVAVTAKGSAAVGHVVGRSFQMLRVSNTARESGSNGLAYEDMSVHSSRQAQHPRDFAIKSWAPQRGAEQNRRTRITGRFVSRLSGCYQPQMDSDTRRRARPVAKTSTLTLALKSVLGRRDAYNQCTFSH